MSRFINLLVSCLLILPLAARAGVAVVQNGFPGAASWPGIPLISTAANPSSTATVSESFNGGGGNTNLGESFAVTTTNFTLQTIEVYAGGGSGTGFGTNLVLNLYDLGTQSAPNPNNYASSIVGGNLLGSGGGLSVSYNPQTAGVLEFDFNGADQVTLTNGHTYVFELSGALNTTPVFWYRGTSDTYPGGAAYRNRAWINGNSARDFALAVYAPGGTAIIYATNSARCIVDSKAVHQRIDGFGASSAWRGTWTTAQADMFFSTNSGTGVTLDGQSFFPFTGAGLSLLRTRIAPGGTTVENSIMQMAQARGAQVWSTPWSPAAPFKSNTNVDGGSFVGTPANYQAYANQLAGYVVNMKNLYGVNLYALSLQNEPDANVTTYESCNWSAQQFHDFIPYLYNALVSSNVGSTKIILPESQNWTDPSGLESTTMGDITSNDVAIIANHDYVANNNVGDQTTPAAINSYGKGLWETEVSLLAGNDSSITNAVYWAGRVHLYLTAAQANAWHYWWLLPGTSSGNEGLTDTNGIPAKRMYALGNFSRFVRPNYYRIDVPSNSGPALISAYKDSVSSNFAIVAINTSGNIFMAQTFGLTNFNASSVIPWVTSDALSLAAQPAVSVSNGSFTYTLPAMSVVTFTGQAISNPQLTLAGVSNQTINAGFMLAITNVATDSGSSSPALAYSLLAAPTNSTLDPATGVFLWRPLVAQAGTTNLVSVEVADNELPPLSATNSFNVVVNPLVQPTLTTVPVSGNRLNLVINGLAGPDYAVQVSTNLADWQVLFRTNSPALPVTFTTTNNALVPAQFFRVAIGP